MNEMIFNVLSFCCSCNPHINNRGTSAPKVEREYCCMREFLKQFLQLNTLKSM